MVCHSVDVFEGYVILKDVLAIYDLEQKRCVFHTIVSFLRQNVCPLVYIFCLFLEVFCAFASLALILFMKLLYILDIQDVGVRR